MSHSPTALVVLLHLVDGHCSRLMYTVAIQEGVVEGAVQLALHLTIVYVGHGAHCGLQEKDQHQYEHVLKR